MARIRTIKPEAFTSESLAKVSISAERTFFGLLTQADDHGRHRDQAAIIAGLLWPLRPEHTAMCVEEDLTQLEAAGLICRYKGCDGKPYLHVVTWFQHQKINNPSASRLPGCSEHQHQKQCGVCKATPCAKPAVRLTPSTVMEGSVSPHPELTEPSGSPTAGLTEHSLRSAVAAESAGQNALAEESPSPTAGLGEDYVSPTEGLSEGSGTGSRILDPGSSNPSGRTAPAPAPSARALIGEYVAGCSSRPPKDVLGHLGRKINQLLDEGIAPEHIRAGLERFRAKPMHPSVLPSLVNEAMNAGPGRLVRPEIRSNVPGHTAWTNPVDAAAAYAEEL
ncbi:hypothetical protein ACFXJ5_09165 [Streptomyces sp. NPDC059373]